jgi:hypothetical protein
MNDYKTPYRKSIDPDAGIVGPLCALAAVVFFILLWSGAV